MLPRSYADMVKGFRGPPPLPAPSATPNRSRGAAPRPSPSTSPFLSKPSHPPFTYKDVSAAVQQVETSRIAMPKEPVPRQGNNGPQVTRPAEEDEKDKGEEEEEEEMAQFGATEEDLRVNSPYAAASTLPMPSSSATAAAAAASAEFKGPNAHLWFDPKGADIIIKCRDVHWEVHRRVLTPMSEWIEKHLPPEPKDDEKPVLWSLDNWDQGMLGAILQYMYLEDYKGGDYDPMEPLGTHPIVHAVAHFLAGTAVLCRPMMDQALDQIETAATEIAKKMPLLSQSVLDSFEFWLRRALMIMYDEPDQWRIRALRIVMGKLMAVCFPVILQNRHWSEKYQACWGTLRVRVVTDHKWLYQIGQVEKNNVIMSGFESMDILWAKYRGEGWQPSDDLVFPERECEDLPAPPSPSPSSTTAAGKNKMSKAIPIMRPDGTPADPPARSRPGGNHKEKKHPVGLVEPKPKTVTEKSKDKDKYSKREGKGKAEKKTLVEPSAKTKAGGGSPCAAEPSRTLIDTPSVDAEATATPKPPVFPDPTAPPGSAAWWAFVLRQPFPYIAPPFHDRPQSWPGTPRLSTETLPAGPFLPAGSHYFAETSTGTPAGRNSINVPEASFATADPFVDLPSHAPTLGGDATSADAVESPTRRMAELYVGFDDTTDDTTPRPQQDQETSGDKAVRP